MKKQVIARKFSRLSDIPTAWMEHARIPRTFLQADISSSDTLTAFVKAMPGNLTRGAGLLLTGPHGTGKTYGACAVALHALKHTPRVMYLTAPALIDALKPDAPKFDDQYSQIGMLESRDLLVVDDLGAEYRHATSGFSEQNLINLFRYRVQEKRATIITTNLTGDKIEELYGPGMRSLLNELCTPVVMKGVDKRKDPAVLKQKKKDAGL